jgi:hypothetical protein
MNRQTATAPIALRIAAKKVNVKKASRLVGPTRLRTSKKPRRSLQTSHHHIAALVDASHKNPAHTYKDGWSQKGACCKARYVVEAVNIKQTHMTAKEIAALRAFSTARVL